MIQEMIDDELLIHKHIQGEAIKYFFELTGAPSPNDLDDGEAATLAIAITEPAIAIIDERKATKIANELCPETVLFSSLDIFSLQEVEDALTPSGISEALFNAIKHARMRVPAEYVGWVHERLELGQLQECSSMHRWLKTG
jgi:hypothetical protein